MDTQREPQPRCGHAAVTVDNKLHLWGGYAGSNKKSQQLVKTVEVFDISTEMWEQVRTHGTPPPGLSNAAYTVVGTYLYSFGGTDGSRHNTLHKLDLYTLKWEAISHTSRSPHEMVGSGMVSYGDNQLVLFAGLKESDHGSLTNGVHIFNLDKREH